MKADQFRLIALSMVEALESEHMGHADFRVAGRIFATLGYPDKDCGAVMLTPEEQEKFLRTYPEVFSPAKGAWGRRGSTVVKLKGANTQAVREAMTAAWRYRAPKRLIDRGIEAKATGSGARDARAKR